MSDEDVKFDQMDRLLGLIGTFLAGAAFGVISLALILWA